MKIKAGPYSHRTSVLVGRHTGVGKKMAGTEGLSGHLISQAQEGGPSHSLGGSQSYSHFAPISNF